MHRTVLSFLAVSLLSASAVFSQGVPSVNPPTPTTCSLDKVPEDYTDTAKYESRPSNPQITSIAIESSEAELPVKFWDYRTYNKVQYVTLFGTQGATDPKDAFAILYDCAAKDYRAALRVNGRWLAAKNLNTPPFLINPNLDSKGKLVSVTVSLETVEGLKEVILSLK